MKSKQDYLKFRPLNCRHCGGRRLHAHGGPSSERQAKALRFYCVDCRTTQTVHVDSLVGALSESGIKENIGDLARDFGLLSLGLPLKQIENLVGHKAETIQRRLSRCRSRADVWKAILASLVADYDLSKDDINRLEKISRGRNDHSSPFHRAFASRADVFRSDDRTIQLREALRVRIERILRGQVAYTGRGEFWRADIDVARIAWIERIRRADEREIDPQLLGELLSAVAAQVRCPNGRERALAFERPSAPAMTLSCLCSGMDESISLPEFMDSLKEISRVLAKL